MLIEVAHALHHFVDGAARSRGSAGKLGADGIAGSTGRAGGGGSLGGERDGFATERGQSRPVCQGDVMAHGGEIGALSIEVGRKICAGGAKSGDDAIQCSLGRAELLDQFGPLASQRVIRGRMTLL